MSLSTAYCASAYSSHAKRKSVTVLNSEHGDSSVSAVALNVPKVVEATWLILNVSFKCVLVADADIAGVRRCAGPVFSRAAKEDRNIGPTNRCTMVLCCHQGHGGDCCPPLGELFDCFVADVKMTSDLDLFNRSLQSQLEHMNLESPEM